MSQLPELLEPEDIDGARWAYTADQMRAFYAQGVADGIAEKEAEILRLHVELADIKELREMAITLSKQARADIAQARAELASVKQEPLSVTQLANLGGRYGLDCIQFARAIEAAHGIGAPTDNAGDQVDKSSNLQGKLVDRFTELQGGGAKDGINQQESRASAENSVVANSPWLPIESAPKDEGISFLVLLPGNDMADSIVLQVSIFEGNMYPDHKDGAIDYDDRVTTATHWMPLPPPPVLDGEVL